MLVATNRDLSPGDVYLPNPPNSSTRPIQTHNLAFCSTTLYPLHYQNVLFALSVIYLSESVQYGTKFTDLPTIISSTSPAFFLKRHQMSTVKMVLLLLNIDVSDDVIADSMTATISPRAPVGRRLSTRSGYAMFVHPAFEPQISMHLSGSEQATSSGNREERSFDYLINITGDRN